jgi:hypothetical protein
LQSDRKKMTVLQTYAFCARDQTGVEELNIIFLYSNFLTTHSIPIHIRHYTGVNAISIWFGDFFPLNCERSGTVSIVKFFLKMKISKWPFFRYFTKNLPLFKGIFHLLLYNRLFTSYFSFASRPCYCTICAYFLQIAHFNEVNACQVAHLTIFFIFIVSWTSCLNASVMCVFTCGNN